MAESAHIWTFGLPEDDGYSEKPCPIIETSEFISGKRKYRKQSTLSRVEVSVSFVLTLEAYDYFNIFYDNTNSGTDAFQMELLTGTHDVCIIPGSLNVKSDSPYVKISFTVEYFK